MVRGPQTVGELRGRTERLYTFDDLEAVESTLHRLAEMEFVKQLPRQTGFKEPRFTQLLSGDVQVAEEEPETSPVSASGRGSADRERIAVLEAEVAQLKREFEEFRRKFE
jgi:hypothetical protein